MGNILLAFHSLSPLSISYRCPYKTSTLHKRVQAQSLVQSRVVLCKFLKNTGSPGKPAAHAPSIPRLPGGKHYVRQAGSGYSVQEASRKA